MNNTTKAGRKTIYTEPMKTRQIRAPDGLWAKFLRIGGSPWFRAQVDAAPDKITKRGKK